MAGRLSNLDYLLQVSPAAKRRPNGGQTAGGETRVKLAAKRRPSGRPSSLEYLVQVSHEIPAAVRLFSACTLFHQNRVLAEEASRLQYAIDGEWRRGAPLRRIGSRSSARPPSATSG